MVHSFACLYGGQKLLTKWFWAKSASRFPCLELQSLDRGRDGRVRQEGSNAKDGTLKVELQYILDRNTKRFRNRTIEEVLVKWDAYPVEDASWVDLDALLTEFPSFKHEDRVLEEEADVRLQFYIWNILEYISQIVFKKDGFDDLKVLGKFGVGRKILVFVHYGVGWILRLDFELVWEIIWRNSVWENFRSC